MKQRNEIRRGAWANAIGLLAKAGVPLSYLALTRAYGADVFGEYLLAFFIANLFGNALGGGFMDAVTVFAAPAAELRGQAELCEVTATSMRGGLLGALAWLLLAVLAARPVSTWLYPGHDAMPMAILLASVGVLPTLIARVVVGLGKAHLEMRWEPLLFGLVGPGALTAFGLVARRMGGGLTELFVALLLSQLVVGALSLLIMRRWLSLTRLMRALVSWRTRTPRVTSFGFTQACNLGVSRYAARLDVMMLGAFGLPAWQLGWYATAAMIATELRQLRVIYATIATPLIARAKRRAALSNLRSMLHTLSQRSSLLALPTLIILWTLMGDVLGLFDARYGQADFILWLFLAPALSCTFGFAGNFLVASGHQRVNLTNAIVAATVNTALNVWLIPRLGLAGAAIGTAISQLALVSLENLQLWRLEGLRLSARHLLLAGAGSLALFTLLWLMPIPSAAYARATLVGVVLAAALTAHASFPRRRVSRGKS